MGIQIVTSSPVFDAQWRRWIIENKQLNKPIEGIVAAMVRRGFSVKFSKKTVAETVPYQYASLPWQLQRTIQTHDRLIHARHFNDQPRILLLENVLSPEECDELIARSRSKLARSTALDKQTGAYITIGERTSENAYYRNNDPFVQVMNRRFSEIMHLPMSHGEDLQVVRYTAGGEYREHWDYFPMSDPGSLSATQDGGQRTATLLMYLNDVPVGGSTYFPKINYRVQPRKGWGVYFQYTDDYGQVDDLTLHAGEPVLHGEKWIATKWMRVKPRA